MISLGFQKHCVFCLVFLKMCNNKKKGFNSLTSKLYYSLKVSSMGEILLHADHMQMSVGIVK